MSPVTSSSLAVSHLQFHLVGHQKSVVELGYGIARKVITHHIGHLASERMRV